MSDRAVAVFGSSEPGPEEPLYRDAMAVGGALAEAGFDVVTGGYGGVMEAASRGARDAGGSAFGVLCAWFEGRRANPYLTGSITAPDLYVRTRELIERSWGFVVLEGKAGTLAELAFLWALHRAGRLRGAPVVLFKDAWTGTLERLRREGRLDPPQAESCHRAGTPREVVRVLTRYRDRPTEE